MLDSPRTPFCAPASIRGKHWSPLPLPASVAAPSGVPELAARIARARGVSDMEGFFRPSFKAAMPDPSALMNMGAAAARFAQAIEKGETIGLIGDYDVDGATSTSIVLRFLAMVGHRAVGWRIPHRIADGYGPNAEIVSSLHDIDAVTLLLVLDSGTTSFDAVSHARSLGMDVLVLDHHEPDPDRLPDAVLVNPKQLGEDRSLEYLCTAGLAFLFSVAVTRALRHSGRFSQGAEPDLKSLLGLVALGTVADVVPLVGLNRAYVALGLPRLADVVGIRALAEVTGKPELTTHACGFVFGPCLNAAGRIDDMRMSVELLTSEDANAAKTIAEHLFKLNQERRELQIKAVEEAKIMIDADKVNASGVIVVYSAAWHPGVVGLVAARIREAYDRPAIAIGAEGKGSARSVDGFHVGAAVISAYKEGILIKGGGHGAAAGLTINPAKVPDLKAKLDAAYAKFSAPPVPVDLALPCGVANAALVRSLEILAPFGMGNPKPRLAVVGGFGRTTRIMKGLHVKLVLSGPAGEMDVLAFNSVGTPLGDALLSAEGRYVDVMGTVEISSWNGVDRAMLKPEDVMIGKEMDAVAA